MNLGTEQDVTTCKATEADWRRGEHKHTDPHLLDYKQDLRKIQVLQE